MAITSQGIGSGLDIAGIVDKLMTVEQAPLNRLQAKAATYQTKLSAYSSLKGLLSNFQSSLSSLVSSTGIATVKASIANTDAATVALTANTSNQNLVGAHSLQIDNLAQNQKIASASFSSLTSNVGTGALTIQFGSYSSDDSSFTPNTSAGSVTINIGSANQTLSGIRDAINAANAGISASIINNGSGYQLVMSAQDTGLAKGFRVSVAPDIGGEGLAALAYDPSSIISTTTRLQKAGDAQVWIDNIKINKASNIITDVLDGLTLTLKAPTTSATTLTIDQDTSAASNAVNAFVNNYNTLSRTLSQLTAYNADTKTAGLLNGDPSTRLISNKLRSLISSTVPGSDRYTTLADIGINLQKDGTLALDQSKLSSALKADASIVTHLFAATGSATDSLISYQSASNKTQAGNYGLVVNQLATQGSLTGSGASGLVITAGVNDRLSLTIDNVSTELILQAGSYASVDALADELRAKISGAGAFSDANVTANVSVASGILTVTSQRYGSASVIQIAGTAANTLFGGSPVTNAGADVAGTLGSTAFLGQGQKATGQSGNGAEGLAVLVKGGSTGDRGLVSYTQGIAAQFSQAISGFIADDDNGLLASQSAGISATLKDLQAQQSTWNQRLVSIRARYEAQYNAMDALMASMNRTSTYLTQQITALQALNKQ